MFGLSKEIGVVFDKHGREKFRRVCHYFTGVGEGPFRTVDYYCFGVHVLSVEQSMISGKVAPSGVRFSASWFDTDDSVGGFLQLIHEARFVRLAWDKSAENFAPALIIWMDGGEVKL